MWEEWLPAQGVPSLAIDTVPMCCVCALRMCVLGTSGESKNITAVPIFAYVLMVDTTRCMLSPPSPAPLASPLTPPPGGCVFCPVCDMRMWCDDAWGHMLLHGSWWREGRGGLWHPTCEFLDGARYPTPHRR